MNVIADIEDALVAHLGAAEGHLSLAGAPGVAAVNGMSDRPEARGRGGFVERSTLTVFATASPSSGDHH